MCDLVTQGGASVGQVSVNSLLFVDDCTIANTNINDTIVSHESFQRFSTSKRLESNPGKCKLMIINKKKTDSCPTLVIKGHVIKEVESVKMLGDVFNCKGNNSDLVSGKVNTCKAVIASIFAVCNEITFGMHYMRVMYLLYKTVFIPSMLFNSQAWSNISSANITTLQTSQLKCLKRMLKVPTSTPNACTFLELGVLPIKFEVQSRQLLFLKHILSLTEDDPVRKLFNEQKLFPFEKNWANNIAKVLQLYELPNEKDINEMSKDKWRRMVKEKIKNKAWKDLMKECEMRKKTKNLIYTTFSAQSYLFSYQSDIATTIFRIRAKSTNCKENTLN